MDTSISFVKVEVGVGVIHQCKILSTQYNYGAVPMSALATLDGTVLWIDSGMLAMLIDWHGVEAYRQSHPEAGSD